MIDVSTGVRRHTLNLRPALALRVSAELSVCCGHSQVMRYDIGT